MREKVLIIGAGGHARSVIDILLQNNEYEVIGCIDNQYCCDEICECMSGIPVIGNDDMLPDFLKQGIKYCFVALGNNKLRALLYEKVCEMGYIPINAISKHAIISDRAQLGNGICIMAGAILNVNVQVGDNSIINTRCSVDHDCVIGEHCHIAPGVTMSGTTVVGDYTQLGTGSNVIDGITIGANSFIGAGAVVVNDIPPNVMAYGVPAKIVRNI